MDNFAKLIVFFCVIALCSCGVRDVPRPVSLGAGGAAAGAGVGALVGSLISNGDIGMSAALGAGVGAAVGVVGGYIVDQMEQAEVRRIDRDVRITQLEIEARQKEIDSLHQRALDGSQRGEPDDSRRERIYDGQTLGNYYR